MLTRDLFAVDNLFVTITIDLGNAVDLRQRGDLAATA